jgi:hypothetical protein
MTATTVMADSLAEVRMRNMPSETIFQENTAASEKTENSSVVQISARLRPHRSASQPAASEPRNMPANDSEVT